MLQPGVQLLDWSSECRVSGCRRSRWVKMHIHRHRGHAQRHAVGQQERRDTMRDADAVAHWGGGGIGGPKGQGRAQAFLLGWCWVWRRGGRGVLTGFKLSAPPVLHALQLNVSVWRGTDLPLLKYSLQLKAKTQSFNLD